MYWPLCRYRLSLGLLMSIFDSDTVAPTLVFLFYHIALFPAQAETLRKDLQTVSSIYDVNELQSLLSLNAFINETLRLFPTTPTGGYRETPAEGINVAGHYIPGNTTIVAPAYNIGRRKFALLLRSIPYSL